jgi:hypothetical protein
MHKNGPSAYLGEARLEDAFATVFRCESGLHDCITGSSIPEQPRSFRDPEFYCWSGLVLPMSTLTLPRAELRKCWDG